jgi:hypothetical protein
MLRGKEFFQNPAIYCVSNEASEAVSQASSLMLKEGQDIIAFNKGLVLTPLASST